MSGWWTQCLVLWMRPKPEVPCATCMRTHVKDPTAAVDQTEICSTSTNCRDKFRLWVATLSQQSFRTESDPNFPWKNLEKVYKEQRKKQTKKEADKERSRQRKKQTQKAKPKHNADRVATCACQQRQ